MVFKYISLRRKQPQRKKRRVHFRAKGSNRESHHQDSARGVHACWKAERLQKQWNITSKVAHSGQGTVFFSHPSQGPGPPMHCTWTSGCLVTRSPLPNREPEEWGRPQKKIIISPHLQSASKKTFFFFASAKCVFFLFTGSDWKGP